MATAENMKIMPAIDTAPNSLVPLPSDPGEFLGFIADAVKLMMGQQGNRLMPGIQSQHELAMIMGYAATLGLNPLSATQEIHIINGRMAISAEAMRALANRAGVKLGIISEDAEHCSIKLTRNGQEHTETFTLSEAKQAGLVKSGGNWTKWPKQMLRARCTTNGIRFFCPDVLQGALEIGEAQDIPEPAYQPRVVEPEPEPEQPTYELEPHDDAIEGEIEPEEEPQTAADPDEKARQDLVDALQRNGYVEATHKQWIECALEIDTPLEELTAAQCIAAWKRIKEIRQQQSQQQGTATAAEEEPQPVATPAPQAGDFTSKNPLENVAPIYTLWQYAGLTTAQIRSILAEWGGEISADDISAAELLSCWEITWSHLAYAQDGKLTWQEVA